MPDYSQLKSILLSSGIQQKNNPLYQVIDTLIGNLITTQKQLDVISGGSGGNLNASFLTQKDETSTLPNSLQEIAGSGIQISDIGKRRIISTAIPISFIENNDESYEYPIIQGPSGSIGPIGNTGIPGMDGTDGDDGIIIPGPTGLTGPIGPSGISGQSGLLIGLNDNIDFEFEPVINIGTKELWKLNGLNIYYTDGNVGIGTSTPNTLFHIATPTGVDTVGQFARFGSGSSYFRRGATNTDFMGTSITPGNQNIRLITAVDIGSSEVVQLYVDAVNSRIGIGNSAPTVKLDVTGDIYSTGGTHTIKSGNWVSNSTGSLSNFGGGDVGFYAVSGSKLQFVTSGANVVIIDSSGFIGVNTTSPGLISGTPGALIDIEGPSGVNNLGPGLAIGNTTFGNQWFIHNDNTGSLKFALSGTLAVTLDLSGGVEIVGNLGVGIVGAPSFRVDVNGIVHTNNAFDMVSTGQLQWGNSSNERITANTSAHTMGFDVNGNRAINLKSTGGINTPNLPTSTAGLSTGDIWVDTTGGFNILKIV